MSSIMPIPSDLFPVPTPCSSCRESEPERECSLRDSAREGAPESFRSTRPASPEGSSADTQNQAATIGGLNSASLQPTPPWPSSRPETIASLLIASTISGAEIKVYYAGPAHTFGSAGRLTFGVRGIVIGRPAKNAGEPQLNGQASSRLAVKFQCVDGPVSVSASYLSVHEPEVPGGFRIGEVVFFIGAGEFIDDGQLLHFGLEGIVVGRCDSGMTAMEHLVEVDFVGFNRPTSVVPSHLSRHLRALPGGFQIGDVVFYAGEHECFPDRDGDHLCFGMRGEIVGHSTSDAAVSSSRIKVLFEGNCICIDVPLAQLCSDFPSLFPTGFSVGEKVYYTDSYEQLADGDNLIPGMCGEVVSSVISKNAVDSERMVVRFSGHKHVTVVSTSSLSKVSPAFELASSFLGA